MAVNLTAVFKLRDEGSSKLRKLTQYMNNLRSTTDKVTKSTNTFRDSNGRLRDSMGRYVAETNRARTASSGFSTSLLSLRNNSNSAKSSLSGMQSTLLGIAGAYLTAHGAAKAFESTIGAAAKYEQAEITVKAMFNNDELSKQYLDLVENMAIDSPLLNSSDMMSNSKAIVGITKNIKELEGAWGIIERLLVLAPEQGTEGAAYAFKELLQGDSQSMFERFGLSRKELNRIKALDVSGQVAEMDKLLSGMGVTEKTVESMGSTTLGYWSQITERAQKFGRLLGLSSNTKLGEVLGNIITQMDSIDMDELAGKFGDKLGEITEKVVNVVKWLWKWREPLMAVAKVVGTFALVLGSVLAIAGTVAAVGVAIGFLTSPIGLIVLGITAAVFAFKALYDNSETFRNAIDGIISRVQELWGVFKSDGLTGVFDAILPKDMASKVNGIIGAIQSLFATFKESGVGGVVDSLFGEGTFDSLKAKFEEVKTYIATKIAELSPTFERFKQVFSVVWSTVSSIISNAWSIIEPILSGLWSIIQVIGGIIAAQFNNVVSPALSFLATLFQTLWAIAQPILLVLGGLFEALGAIIKWLWDNILSPLVNFILGGLKNAFDAFSDALSIVGGWFENITDWAQLAKDKLGQFADFISGIKLPDWVTNGISTVVKTVSKVIGGKPDGSNYHGLAKVPYDGYVSMLHKGEMVLTRQEADAYRSSMAQREQSYSNVSYETVQAGITNNTTNYNSYSTTNNSSTTEGKSRGNQRPVTVNLFGTTIREDADVDKLADKLVWKLIEAEAAGV